MKETIDERLVAMLKDTVRECEQEYIQTQKNRKLPSLYWTALSMSLLAAVSSTWLTYMNYDNARLRAELHKTTYTQPDNMTRINWPAVMDEYKIIDDLSNCNSPIMTLNGILSCSTGT